MDMSDLQSALNGMIVAQFSPYTTDDAVDTSGLRENTEFLVDFAAVEDRDIVLLANGSTGENYANSHDEAVEVIETVVDMSGDVPVLAGTGSAGTKEAIRKTKAAAEAGADGALVVSPYYRSATESGLVRHYTELANSVDLGIVAYYNADVSGATIPPNVVEELAAIENIVGIKYGTPLASEFYATTRVTDPEDIVLLSSGGGPGYISKAALGDRCRGFFSVIGNFAPELAYELYLAVDSGDFDRANNVLAEHDPFWNFVGEVQSRRKPTSVLPRGWGTNHMFLPVGKAAMDLVGLHGGTVRSPEVDLTVDERSELEDVLGEMGVL